MLALWIVVGVLVLLIVALPFAKRRDQRKGHEDRSMGDIRSTIRSQRMELRNARSTGYRKQSQRRPGRKGH